MSRWPALTAAERFHAKVDRSGGPGACWPWTRPTVKGYGYFRLDGRNVRAHRLAWELENGSVPDGAQIDHRCHNGTGCPGGPSCLHRGCCNPAHLEPVTAAVNNERSHNWPGNATHCPSDHEYTPENTRVRVGPDGQEQRDCRTCKRASDLRRYHARVAATAPRS